MKYIKSFLVSILLILVTTNVKAQTDPFKVIVLQSDIFVAGFGNNADITPLYLVDKCVGPVCASFFGFGEFRWTYGEKLFASVFTNHAPTLTHRDVPYIGLVQEIGGSSDGGFFYQVGPKVNLTSLPFVGKTIKKAFVALGVSWVDALTGKPYTSEIIVGWSTKKLSIGSVTLRSDGFMRFGRTGQEIPSLYGQPAAWIGMKDVPIEVGLECDVAGPVGDVRPYCRGGLRVSR